MTEPTTASTHTRTDWLSAGAVLGEELGKIAWKRLDLHGAEAYAEALHILRERGLIFAREDVEEVREELRRFAQGSRALVDVHEQRHQRELSEVRAAARRLPRDIGVPPLTERKGV